MGRTYTQLECGCLVSEDGGGGLIPCEFHFDNLRKKGDPLDKWFKEIKEENAKT